MKNDNMTRISFRISVEEKEALLALAARNDLTLSQVIRRAIKNMLGPPR